MGVRLPTTQALEAARKRKWIRNMDGPVSGRGASSAVSRPPCDELWPRRPAVLYAQEPAM